MRSTLLIKDVHRKGFVEVRFVAGLHVSKLHFFLLARFQRFIFLLTSAEMMAFNWLKALFSA